MRLKVDLKAAVSNIAEHVVVEKTFAELVDAYCAVVYDGADLRMRKWVVALGDLSAWEVKTEQVTAAAKAMVEAGYKVSSVNRDTSQIGTIYRWAIEKNMPPKGFISPTRGIPRYEEDMRRVEISAAEIAKLLKGAHGFRDRRFAVYVRLLHDTGCRKGEVVERRWKDVDLDNCTITCQTTKTGKPRVLHFTPETAALMLRVWPKRNPDDLLFEGRIKGSSINYRAQWSALTTAIGRPDLHQHDLRHHRAAELLKAGNTLAVASQVLGHSSLILHKRYGHLETGHLKAAIQASWGAAA
jgi:integrase